MANAMVRRDQDFLFRSTGLRAAGARWRAARRGNALCEGAATLRVATATEGGATRNTNTRLMSLHDALAVARQAAGRSQAGADAGGEQAGEDEVAGEDGDVELHRQAMQ